MPQQQKVEVINLVADPAAEFDWNQAVSMKEAAKRMRGRMPGRTACKFVATRWATRGWSPRGKPVRIILPTVRLDGYRWTMNAWIDKFEKARMEWQRVQWRPVLGPGQ